MTQKARPSDPTRKDLRAPRSRKRARHAIKGNKVNVGYPNGSLKRESKHKHKSEEIEMANRKSDES